MIVLRNKGAMVYILPPPDAPKPPSPWTSILRSTCHGANHDTTHQEKHARSRRVRRSRTVQLKHLNYFNVINYICH